jgi:hypothetical protein
MALHKANGDAPHLSFLGDVGLIADAGHRALLADGTARREAGAALGTSRPSVTSLIGDRFSKGDGSQVRS